MKAWLGWGLKLVATLLVLVYVFHKIHFSTVWAALETANPWYVLAGFVLLLLMRDATAQRMQRLTKRQGMTLTVKEIFAVGCITSFYGLFLPGFLAGGLRWHRLSRNDKKPTHLLVAILGDRLIDMIVLVGFGVAFWIVDAQSRAYLNVGICLSVMLAGLLSLSLIIFHRRISRWVWHCLAKIAILPGFLRGKIQKMDESIRHYHGIPKREMVWLIWLSIARHMIGIASAYCMALALRLPLNFTNVGWVRCSLMLVGLLPISISGLGVSEVSSVFLLRYAGVHPADAVAWSLLLFSRTLFAALMGGVLELKHVFFSQRAARCPAAASLATLPVDA